MTPTWDNPAEYARCVARSYRRDFWNQQPVCCEVWSEKGTVRGVLEPVLDQYAVGFRVMHGFSGATTIYDVSHDGDGRPVIILYVGDFDPSGMFMSEADLPKRLSEYGGNHVTLRRIALTPQGGLLRQIGDFGILALKDFGSILSMRPDAKAELLAALRELYDGA